MSKPRRCPFDRCDGSGILVDEETRTATYCACRPQLVAATRTRGLAGVIPRRYRGLSFDRAPITSIRSGIVSAVRSYVAQIDERLDDGEGLWLSGPVGTGKTSLAMLVSAAALAAGRTVAIYSLPRLLAEIRTTFDADATTGYTALLDRLTEVDLLHIDDVGAEKTSEWVLEQLYAIINARYEQERALLITTNLERDELCDQIGARSVSRIEEMCELLPVGGEDMRRPRHGAPAGDMGPAPAPFETSLDAELGWATGSTPDAARPSPSPFDVTAARREPFEPGLDPDDDGPPTLPW